ncbi:TPP-dependent indolepyruvate ferredoxin oxidoreductase alpha subunit [Methanomicrobium sp. W14]|uniref:thiamine pyrophosphate-dependent enzyme n=1 Tax=Methanomicrobium sp. W14 TaxID=2817839 RepID=UPI001AE8EF81|nr:thiamine pyrophosphate-dependent enzyme [Methanomicrobium sp. W14]MBP2134073.1 TPP-dependent indolepyruvate ferredoxin oxidoreductase alpha subunit [Methanomicrobium sp. W14]
MKTSAVLAEAVIKGADTCYCVPGYPVTELAEMCRSEYVINEKTALEYALGDSLSGLRSVVIVKNAGMNALCDPLVQSVTQGLRGGVVLIAGDDTEAKGSQNRQNSRYFAEAAKVPLLEPGPEDVPSSVWTAMQVSERFSRVCLIRMTQDVLESCIEGCNCVKKNSPGEYRYGNPAPPDLTMKGRCENADNITAEMFEQSDYPLAWPPQTAGGKITGEKISRKEGLYQISRNFPHEHENSCGPKKTLSPETYEARGGFKTLCKNCPYKTLFEVLTGAGVTAICDTGCSLLSKNPPYGFGVANYGLGSAPAVAAKSTKIAVTGDFALLHSGINSLIDIREKGNSLLCIVLKNRRMAMTGGQVCPDITPYISFLNPVTIDASSKDALKENLMEIPDSLKVVVVEGTCPEGEEHETVKC